MSHLTLEWLAGRLSSASLIGGVFISGDGLLSFPQTLQELIRTSRYPRGRWFETIQPKTVLEFDGSHYGTHSQQDVDPNWVRVCTQNLALK